MTVRACAKRILSLVLTAACLHSLPLFAWAEEPADYKAGLSAQSVALDWSGYADGSQFFNPPTTVETVRVGLRYEDTADYEAVLENASGAGFAFGRYDENRDFIELGRCDDAEIMVIGYGEAPIWHILLNARYDSLEAARQAADFYQGQVVSLEGNYRVYFENHRTWDGAFEAIQDYELGARPFTDAAPGLRVTSMRNGAVLYRAEKAEEELAILPLPDGETALTRFRGESYRGGFAFRVFENDRLTVINSVPLEDYVKGVIPYEMDPLWPVEALRAQAVCARTYAVYNQDGYPRYGFDLTDNTESQVYKGVGEANAATDLAAESTAGQLIRYQGEICEIYYFAADGGSTEDGINVFETDRPYLAGKLDPFEGAVEYPLQRWETRYDGETLAGQLARRGYDIGPIAEITPAYSESGNVIALSYVDTNGDTLRIAGRPCYTSIRLNSCHFTVTKDGAEFVFTGGGLGHSCGLSQWGAYAMALCYGCDYEDIIRFYYTGAYIA